MLSICILGHSLAGCTGSQKHKQLTEVYKGEEQDVSVQSSLQPHLFSVWAEGWMDVPVAMGRDGT